MEKIDKSAAEYSEWGGTRLICIASDFNRYDEHAVQQIKRNIELMRYPYFGNELLLLELVNAQTVNQSAPPTTSAGPSPIARKPAKAIGKDKSQEERLLEAPPSVLDLYESACQYIEQLGDEVQRKELRLYTAFKRIRNFISIVVQSGKDPRLQMYLKLPGLLGEESAFSRNVEHIGHWGAGNLEVTSVLRRIEKKLGPWWIMHIKKADCAEWGGVLQQCALALYARLSVTQRVERLMAARQPIGVGNKLTTPCGFLGKSKVN